LQGKNNNFILLKKQMCVFEKECYKEMNYQGIILKPNSFDKQYLVIGGFIDLDVELSCRRQTITQLAATLISLN